MSKPTSKKIRPPPTPKQPKPWDVPPFPTSGNSDLHEIYHSVGWAVATWNDVETVFGALFSDLNGIVIGGEGLERAYGSVITFKARAEMLASAAEVYFHKYPHPGNQQRLKWLMEKALGFAARRNEIAHGIVARYRWFVPGNAKGKGTGLVIGPSMFSTNKRILHSADGTPKSPKLKPKYVYSVAEIDALNRAFSDLYNDGVKLHHILWSQNWDRQPPSPEKLRARRGRPAKGDNRSGRKG